MMNKAMRRQVAGSLLLQALAARPDASWAGPPPDAAMGGGYGMPDIRGNVHPQPPPPVYPGPGLQEGGQMPGAYYAPAPMQKQYPAMGVAPLSPLQQKLASPVYPQSAGPGARPAARWHY